jgi:hypothetical protein
VTGAVEQGSSAVPMTLTDASFMMRPSAAGMTDPGQSYCAEAGCPVPVASWHRSATGAVFLTSSQGMPE